LETQRTIETILDLETGALIETEELFSNSVEQEDKIFKLRTEIEEQIQTDKVRYVCVFCKKPVALRGRTNNNKQAKTFYFTHPYKSPDCIIKTTHRLSEEEVRRVKYNGVKESALHNYLKNRIAYYLNIDNTVSQVMVEQTFKDVSVSKEWRKPDVLATFDDKKVAFELQLSTTFLSVIVGRTLFYRQRGIFLIWVFPSFSLDTDIQKFTQKDVFYNNSFNVYVFDQEAQDKSEAAGKLVLSCYYKEFYITGSRLENRWLKTYIEMRDISFNTSLSELWYHDSDSQKERLEKELELQQAQRLKLEVQKKIDYKVNNSLDYLRTFYKTDIDPVPDPEFCPLNEMVKPEEWQALEKQLQFTSEKADVIAKLFISRDKPRFLKFICTECNLPVELTHVLIDGRTVLDHVAFIKEEYIFDHYVCLLFALGYPLTERDSLLLKSMFDKNYFNHSDWERQYMERWAFISCLSNLWNKDNAQFLRPIKRILYAFMSLKHKMPIGYKFSSLRQLTMNFLEYHKEHGVWYLKIMEHYGQLEEQLNEDKSGKLKQKINAFHYNTPVQETAYNHIFYELFPEV